MELLYLNFYLRNSTIFGGGDLEHKMCLDFRTVFVSNIVRIMERGTIKNVHMSSGKVPFILIRF